MWPYNNPSQSLSRGFIFLLTLFFLLIFSIITIAELTFVRMNLSIARHRWERMNHLSMSHAVLHELEENLMIQLPSCLISPISTQVLLNYSISYWREHACRGAYQQIRYFYLVELLGRDYCGIVQKIDENQAVVADYYRITLLSFSRSVINRVILQSTFVVGRSTKQACTELPYPAKIGQQTRREL